MDAKELRELIEIISRSNFVTFELEREGFKLRLVKGDASSTVVAISPISTGAPALVASSEAPEAIAPPADAAEEGLVEVRSPIVGTFYRGPSTGAPAFVEVGGRIQKGQTLCIIEAMKLMNEIESEIDAEVVEVVVANGQPVEFGEVLFRLRAVS